jgi:hypothetical protein
MTDVQSNPAKIVALYGVYDADATILGELSYWFGARLGVRHCSLCDITHSLFKQKSTWQECVKELKAKHGVEFQAYHRNDQPDQVREVISGNYPAVVAEDESGKFSLFMDDAEISNSHSSPEDFLAQIIERLSYTVS